MNAVLVQLPDVPVGDTCLQHVPDVMLEQSKDEGQL